VKKVIVGKKCTFLHEYKISIFSNKVCEKKQSKMGHLELKKIIKIFLSKNSYVLYNVKK
jgi:hypothetical protein